MAITDRRVYLKVKIKSLAAEAGIIRHEERRWRKNSDLAGGLTSHRTHVVRPEQRATLLAYAFIRGKSYRDVEPHNDEKDRGPDWGKVKSMVQKYGDWTDYKRTEKLDGWIKEATAVTVAA